MANRSSLLPDSSQDQGQDRSQEYYDRKFNEMTSPDNYARELSDAVSRQESSRVPRDENGRIIVPDGHDYSDANNPINRAMDRDALESNLRNAERDREWYDKISRAKRESDDMTRRTLQDLEAKPSSSAALEHNNPMNYNKGGSKAAQSKNGFWKNRKLLMGLGFGGISGGIVVIFLLLLPLKMDALITNASDAAAKIPGYAVQERTEYLMTRVLAVRMLQLTYGLKDGDIEPVFCKERGNVGCSLLATYTTQRISDRLGMDMVKLPNQTVRVSINAKGRTALGGYARSWEIKLTRDWGDQGVLQTVKKIQTHADMRSYLKTKVNKTYKNTLSRYVARKVLMLKYGVRSWRAFEKTQEKIDNKVADIKTQFKVGMYKNTIGKISPRFAAYLACLQGGTTTCEDLLKNLSSNLEPPGDSPKAGESEEQYQRRKKQYESLEKLGAKIRGEIPDVPTEGMLNSTLAKIFSTRALAAASGVFSAVMITDTVLKAVKGVNDGMLDTIGFDMTAQVYTGFAFGDVTGIVTNWEKIKVGDLEGTTGAEVSNELGTLVDCDGSLLCGFENGISSTLASTTDFTRECSTTDGDKPVTLAAGELVCPERKLYRNYAGLVVNNSAFQSLAQVANAWEATIGPVIATLGNIVDTATSWITGPIMNLLQPVLGKLSELAAPLINWFMDTVFNPPSVGYDTTAANNYDALSGALHLEQWEMMKNGIVDGVTLGGGGEYLSEAESQQILAYQQSEEQNDFNSQSTIAKIFNTSLKGSLAQQAVLQAPTNLASLAKFPAKAFSALFSLPFASAATTPPTSSPFGLPNYSYKLNDPVLTADPNTYTEAYCTESAAAREGSLDKRPGATIKVYTKTDPCALEKLVVGSLITQDNPTDPNAFQPISGTQSTTNTADGTCAANTKSLGAYDKAHDDGKQITVQLCELSSIKLQPGFYTEQDPAIFRSGSGGTIVAANASDQFEKMGEAALAETPARQLVGKGIRSYEKQEYFYNCYITKSCNNGTLAAKPGTSNHENGTAVDFVLGPGDLSWLRANGDTFGIKELTGGSQPEPWHWSPK